MNQVHQNFVISQGTVRREVKYNCDICQDTTWVLDETGTLGRRCECYKKEIAERLWKKFGIKSADVKKINDYEGYDNITKSLKEKAIGYVSDFDSIISLRENGFGIFGQPGSGKSHIVIAIGAALLNRKMKPVEVVYMPYLEVMRELKANVNDDEYYLKLSRRYQKPKLLIIDDLFKDKVNKGKLIGELKDTDVKHIYPIINYRYLNNLPMLVSSECTPNMLLDLDEALAGRILESCGNNITVFKGPSYDYRIKKFIKK